MICRDNRLLTRPSLDMTPQLTRCCVEIIHNYQDFVYRWYTINKVLFRDNRLLTRYCLDMTNNSQHVVSR